MISTANSVARSRRGRRCKCRSTCPRRNCSTRSARRNSSPACATPASASCCRKTSDAGLAIGLGGAGVRLADLARLYAGFPRGGLVPELIENLDDPTPPPRKRRIAEAAAAWYIADILRFAPPPDNAPAGRIAFKTGTSYGYRDALALGFDRAHTVAVLGRGGRITAPSPAWSAGRSRRQFCSTSSPASAAPTIPSRVRPTRWSRPPRALPPPLRHLRRDAPKTLAATFSNPLKIFYPPDGARDRPRPRPHGSGARRTGRNWRSRRRAARRP